jgi:hypothetical protein
MTKVTLTEQEAAKYIGMSRSFLRKDRMDGIRENRTPVSQFLKLGKNIRYLKKDLDVWVPRHRVNRN